MSSSQASVPRGNLDGFLRYFKYDVISGFLVFLIALPLCLAIARASGFPPIAGIFTAIVGSMVTSFISNSEMTIKGPAAGLIVIVYGCVQDFGGGTFQPGDAASLHAYQAALAVAVVAAILQIAFGRFRGGILGEFFPLSAVHGMLAAIGVIIMLKQLPLVLGDVHKHGEPLEIVRELPQILRDANPAIACIGLVSLGIMFLWPILVGRVQLLKPVPSQLVVLLVAIPMGGAFDLLHDHPYQLLGQKFEIHEKDFLVSMPDKMFGMFEQITFPDFGVLTQPVAWKWILMFFAIGTLESMLSAKAIDVLDPWKRRTNMDRDVTAVGVANLCAALVGGLPMISEIVRSKANIMNGARTRFADFWHGVCLLTCVALVPMFLHRIPLAALAAMLVYTGSRLAHPTEFINVYKIGREQLIIFVTTIVAVLATDLLIGIAIGIFVKFVIHTMNGVPLQSLFKSFLEIESQGENQCLIRAHQSAVFSNWIPFRRQLEDIGYVQRQNITLDLSKTKLVDHSVMEKLHEMQADFAQEGLSLKIIGLESHVPVGTHTHAARRFQATPMRRLTLLVDAGREEVIETAFLQRGATGYIALPCRGSRPAHNGQPQHDDKLLRIEALVTGPVCDQLLAYLRNELPNERVTACVETVEVVRRDHIDTPAAERLGELSAH